jgi:hypothetical protein
MIEAAKFRAQISQVTNIQTTIQVFQDSYDALPGDITDAVGYGLGSSAALHNGNGDGRIDKYCFNTGNNLYYNYGKEAYNVFMHLHKAELFPGTFSGYSSLPHGTWWTLNEVYSNFPRGKIYSNSILLPTLLEATSSCNAAPSKLVNAGNSLVLAMIQEANPKYFDRSTMTGDVAKRLDGKVDDGNIETGQVRATHPSSHLAGAVQPGFGSCGTVPPSTFPNCVFVTGLAFLNGF